MMSGKMRLHRVRDSLTDFYFAYNLPYSEFEDLVRGMLAERGASIDLISCVVQPELAPQDLLFEQAEMIETCPRWRGKIQARAASH
jgi:hypothetical protein